MDIYTIGKLSLTLILGVLLLMNLSKAKPFMLFFYSCFLKPIMGLIISGTDKNASHQEKLESFYQTQASAYDATRTRLLRGRDTMLRLSAARLRTIQSTLSNNNKNNNYDSFVENETKTPLVWVDLGGGTGWNIERMNQHFDIKQFDTVYLVDLCPSLCKVATERFTSLGWTNVKVVCEDATKFRLPTYVQRSDPITRETINAQTYASLVTFSYSLSMMDNIYPTIDSVSENLLAPWGSVGVVDFYVSTKSPISSSPSSDSYNRQMSWFSRWFWAVWFDFDNISLHPSRRLYLEHKFNTRISHNARNTSFLPYLVSIPYYVFIGTSKSEDRHQLQQQLKMQDQQGLVSMDQSDSEFSSTLDTTSPIMIRRANSRSTFNEHSEESYAWSCSPIETIERELIILDEAGRSPTMKRLDAPNCLPTTDHHQKSKRKLSRDPSLHIRSAAITSPMSPSASFSSLSSSSDEEEETDSKSGSEIEIHRPSFEEENQVPQSSSSVARSRNSRVPIWRQPYGSSILHDFASYIYAFAWEDPREDLEAMDLTSSDNVLVITSGGCNVLEYALHSPRTIHAVDINPCQNHLLELKCAAITGLEYSDFWRMFGDGHHPRFRELLDNQVSAYLSPHCYNYWKDRISAFTTTKFYYTGWSGLSLRILKGIVKLCGIEKDVEAMCNSPDVTTQKAIWDAKVAPVVLNSSFFRLLNNPMFLWYSWGVPMAQMQLVYDDGQKPYDYIFNTLDPLPARSLFNKDQYFYYLALMSKYHPDSCPTYLKPHAFSALKSGLLDSIRIHTDSINAVYSKIANGTINQGINNNNNNNNKTAVEDEYLTKVVLMDHLDWFNEKEATEEISSLVKVLKKGGKTFWRSASRKPWYNKIFEDHGFEVQPISIRQPGSSIDRVNMYASFYVGTKL